jgi:hypothetical protein
MVTPLKTPVPAVAHVPKSRVGSLANTFLANSERSHECERGTQECVRYERLAAH